MPAAVDDVRTARRFDGFRDLVSHTFAPLRVETAAPGPFEGGCAPSTSARSGSAR
ncbi:hypothetical protein ACFQ9X_15725 [Catenulispora yoronensis]